MDTGTERSLGGGERRGAQPFYLGSNTEGANLVDPATGQPTVFASEYEQVMKAGYRRVGYELLPQNDADISLVAHAAEAAVHPGYGSDRIPDPADDNFGAVVRLYSHLEKDARSDFWERASLTLRSGLSAFAQRMASLAVRNRDASVLVPALVAAAFLADVDWRDALPSVALIHHSATLLGVDADREVFEPVHYLVGPSGQELLDGFLRRPPARRAPEVFGFSEGKDQDGCRYVRS